MNIPEGGHHCRFVVMAEMCAYKAGRPIHTLKLIERLNVYRTFLLFDIAHHNILFSDKRHCAAGVICSLVLSAAIR